MDDPAPALPTGVAGASRQPASRTPAPRWLVPVALSGLLLVLAASYAPVLDAGFLSYDDDKYVTANPWVQAGLTPEGVDWAFGSVHDANWIPLVWVSLMADAELHGLDPAGYHATNLLLHALSTLLLFFAFQRLTGAPWRSLFVAALFGLHPLHVQSVAWIAERKDVLSGVFWMAALLAYAFYVERPGIARYAAVAAALGLGLLCKATLVTLPCVLLLLDVWPARRIGRSDGPGLGRRVSWLVAEKVPLLALSALASAATLGAQSEGGAMRMAHLSLADRVANALVSYVAYLRKTVWPDDLAYFYPHSQPALGSVEVWACAAGLLAVTVASCAWAWRSEGGRPFWVGWSWYLGTLVPMIGLVQVGGQGMADRYMYIPLVGLGIAVAFSLPVRSRGELRVGRSALPGPVAAALFVLALGACAFATHAEAARWQDSETLYRRAIALDPDNYNAHYELARHLNADGRYADAVPHAREAVRLVPMWSDAYLNLGAALLGDGRTDEAVRPFRRALARDPGSLEARLLLATAFIEADRLPEAEVELRRVLRAAPGQLGARISLGSIEERQGNREAALAQYDLVWRSAPGRREAAVAAAHLANLVDVWPEAPGKWVERAHTAARALAASQPEPFEAVAGRLAGRIDAARAAGDGLSSARNAPRRSPEGT